MGQQDREGVPDPDPENRWVKRPWASTFDLISSAYGWTDEQILNMTLSRIWQVRDVILARQADERRELNGRAEAVTKTLVLHVRLAAGDRNAKKAAAAVRLFEDPADSKAPRRKREINTELAPSFAGRLGGGAPLAGLTPELVAAAYGG